MGRPVRLSLPWGEGPPGLLPPAGCPFPGRSRPAAELKQTCPAPLSENKKALRSKGRPGPWVLFPFSDQAECSAVGWAGLGWAGLQNRKDYTLAEVEGPLPLIKAAPLAAPEHPASLWEEGGGAGGTRGEVVHGPGPPLLSIWGRLKPALTGFGFLCLISLLSRRLEKW